MVEFSFLTSPFNIIEAVWREVALAEGGYLLFPSGKSLIYALLPYAFDTLSLDSLQARPCSFFLSFLATPTQSSQVVALLYVT